jgi:hypothetical protein
MRGKEVPQAIGQFSKKQKHWRERERKRKRKTLGEDCIKKNIERGGEELNGSYGR